MLTFNLKKEWFEKIKSGEKTHEYREVKDYWTDRLVKEFFKKDKKKNAYDFEVFKQGMIIFLQNYPYQTYHPIIQFMNGMLSKEAKPRIYAKLKSIKIVNGLNTDLRIDKPVYDIEFELIKCAFKNIEECKNYFSSMDYINSSLVIQDIPELFADEKRKANRIIDSYLISRALGTKSKYSDEEIKHALNFMEAITPPPETNEDYC